MLIQSDIGLVSMLQNTGTISRVVLSVLLVLSIWSWGVILGKALLLRKVHTESDTFWRIFRKGKNLSVPAKDPKYEGRNNTKKTTAKKKG